MSGPSCWIRLGGTTPATELAAHTPPTWETWADGGNGPASFAMALSPRVEPHLLRPSTLVEILCGPAQVWQGRVSDYDRMTGEVSCRGIQVDAQGIPSLTPSVFTTLDLSVSFPVATSAPWNWRATNPRLISGVMSGEASTPIMMSALLDGIAEQEGKRWGQDPRGALYMDFDPTTPTWLISPDAAAFGSTSEGRVTHLVAVYDNGTANAGRIRSVPGVLTSTAEAIDLTPRGTLTQAQVDVILDARLGVRRGRNGWINGVTLGRDQITTTGGQPAFLPMVRARRMARAHGLVYSSGEAPWVDGVIGKTRYTAGEETIYLEPTETMPRTAVDVWAAQSSR